MNEQNETFSKRKMKILSLFDSLTEKMPMMVRSAAVMYRSTVCHYLTEMTEEKIDEIRLVNRAKWLLIECLSMTEADAHRYIEKQAMDLRLSKREVAENIIKTYKS